MKPFSNKLESAYDTNTYINRLKHFTRLSNPFTFFYSNDQLRGFLQNIKNFEEGKAKYSNEELWRFKYALLGNFHSETNEPIFRVGRMSGFLVINAPIIYALAILPPTRTYQIISQSVNQTYNFIMNFCNRNMSTKQNYTQMGIAYVLAVSSAILGSLGMLELSKKLTKSKPGIGKIISFLAPLAGVAVANQANLFFSRYNDILKGVKVQDERSEETLDIYSKKAGRVVYGQMMLSRFIMPTIIILGPALSIKLLDKFKMFPAEGKKSRDWMSLLMVCIFLEIGLTFAIAAFPQYVRFQRQQLEAQFQDLKSKDGQLIERYFVNKGL